MKIVIYSYREDEIAFINDCAKKYDVEVTMCKDALTLDNVDLCKGASCVSIMTTKTDEKIIEKLKVQGIIYISTRTVGFDHIDLTACEKHGIKVGNISYSLSSVSEYTVMMILMALRNMKLILERFQSQDFSLNNIRGYELKNLTVGIIGTGKIGKEVIRLLDAFGCQIIAYDLHPSDEFKDQCKYVSLDELYQNSDIISLHAPSFEATYHMINNQSINLMKKGVIIINTARGSLINTSDLIEALENKQVGYVALDVVEEESLLYYKDLKNEPLNNRLLAILRSFPNVMLSPHTAFFTHQAVNGMVENSFISCKNEYENKENVFRII